MQEQATINAQRHAKMLRRGMTDSERRLWSRLRGEQLGVKFRRQHPLGPYIADFACLSPRMIIELDGSQHFAQAATDHRRDQFFEDAGFKVLRFSTDAPFTQLDGMLAKIFNCLNDLMACAPIPTFPQRGKEPTHRRSL